MKNLIAITQENLGDPLEGIGPLGLEDKDPALYASETFNAFISNAIGIMTVIAIIWFVFKFIGGAISFMNSGGDKNAAESAKKSLTTGVIGIVIVIVSLFLIDFIGSLIGIDILNPLSQILNP